MSLTDEYKRLLHGLNLTGGYIGDYHYIAPPIGEQLEPTHDVINYTDREGRNILKRKDFKFAVGDEVYCLIHGFGRVHKLGEPSDSYPVTVYFDKLSSKQTYTSNGKYRVGGKRVLYFQKPIITDEHCTVTYREVCEPKISTSEALVEIKKILEKTIWR